MKIKTILIAAMLAVTGLTQAQVSEDAFKKAVDYVNCKTVEFSLKGKSDILQQYQQRCSCNDGVGNTEIKNFLASVGGYDATIALANEIELLKKEFNKSWKAEEEVKFLTETIFGDKTKYQKLYLFSDKRKNDAGFPNFKSDLKKDLPAILATQEQASNTSQTNSNPPDEVKPPTLEERVSALEHRPEPKVEDKGWFDGFTFQIDVFSIILSVIIMFLILKIAYGNSDGGSDVSESIKSYVRSKINDAQFKSGGNSGASSFEVNKLKDEIEKLRGEVKQLSHKIESSKIPLEIVQPRYEQQSGQDTKQPEVKSETFFLSTPNSDGSFNDSSVSPTYKEGASIYRFTKVGNNRAKFQIDDREASVKLALTYPDKSIDPVCDAVNAFNPKAKRITTVDVGEAELLNDKWIVNKSQKAKIRYES